MEKLIRIDLGTAEEPQPCKRHKKDGIQDDCDACTDTPARQVPVPELAGLWVEIKNPKLLPYGEKKRLFTPALPILPGDSIDDQLRKRELADERLERIVKGLIVAWNVRPADDNQADVLPVPSKDGSAFERAPDIMGAVIDGIGRANRAEALPKASATS